MKIFFITIMKIVFVVTIVSKLDNDTDNDNNDKYIIDRNNDENSSQQ